MMKICEILRQCVHRGARLLLPALVAGCISGAGSPSNPQDRLYASRLTLVTTLPPAAVTVPPDTETETAATAALLLARADSARATSLRRIEPASAALLYNTGWGRAWVSADQRGAIVRGNPAATCPALSAVNAPSRAAAVEQAIDECRQSIAMQGAADCTCTLIALDDTLLAPLDAFAYAPGIAGRLLGLGARYAGPLVVQEVSAGPLPGEGRVVFADARGPVAEGTLSADGHAGLTLVPDGPDFEGRRERQGWRRGRLTERLLLQGSDGRRIIALIGYEPAVFARDGALLATWPSE